MNAKTSTAARPEEGPSLTDSPLETANRNITAASGSQDDGQIAALSSPPLRVGVTNDELEQLLSFVRQLEVFDEQIRDLTAYFAAERTKAALAPYLADSSHENYQALKLASVGEGMIERNVISKTLKNTVEGTRDTFIINKVLPFVTAIRARNLAALRGELAEVTARENALHVETFGTSITTSVKISEAEQRVRELEGLRVDKNISARKVYDYLHSLPVLEASEGGAPPSL